MNLLDFSLFYLLILIGVRSLNGHFAIFFKLLQTQTIFPNLSTNLLKHYKSPISNALRNFFQNLVRRFLVSSVIGAKMVWVPSFRISAVAAARDVSVQHDPMAFVITFFKTTFANYTSWVLFAVHAAPRNVPHIQIFGANSARHFRLPVYLLRNFCDLPFINFLVVMKTIKFYLHSFEINF